MDARSGSRIQKRFAVPGFPYLAAVANEMVRAPKHVGIALGTILERLETGYLKLPLEPEPVIPVIMEWVLKAGRINEVETYHSSLLINAERVRGIDFHKLPQRRFYREISPAGWHEDIVDPKSGSIRKQAIQLEGVNDMHDFVLFVALRWNIQIEREEELL